MRFIYVNYGARETTLVELILAHFHDLMQFYLADNGKLTIRRKEDTE